mgnify:CR=1 FL=1
MSKVQLSFRRTDCCTFDDQCHIDVGGIILCLPKSIKMEVLKNKCLEEVDYKDNLKKYIEFNSILDNHWEHHLQ